MNLEEESCNIRYSHFPELGVSKILRNHNDVSRVSPHTHPLSRQQDLPTKVTKADEIMIKMRRIKEYVRAQ